MAEMQKRKRIIVRKFAPEEVLSQVEEGCKFIPLESDIDDVPETYMVITIKYNGDSFRALVPQQLVFYLANPGEGGIDDALDEVADFYEDVEDFEDDAINGGHTSVQEVDWATAAKRAYNTYLINKLTTNGKDFDAEVLDQLGLNDKYVADRTRAIAASALRKPLSELKQSDLETVLRHITTTREEIGTEMREVKCWAGSHYEIKRQYVKTKRTVSEHHAVFDAEVEKYEDEIIAHRRGKGQKIGRHDKALIRMYINMASIAKENPDAQLEIMPPEKKNG